MKITKPILTKIIKEEILEEMIRQKASKNKETILQNIYRESFDDELYKAAKLRVGDIEDVVGEYLPDDLEDKARGLIAKEYENRWALRHPVLSLGIGHAISKGNAIDAIVKKMARSEPRVRDMIWDYKKRQRDIALEDAKMQIESDKANQFRNTVTAAVPMAALAANAYANRPAVEDED